MIFGMQFCSKQPGKPIFGMQHCFNLTRLNMDSNLIFFENGRTQFFENGTTPHFFLNGRRPQSF